MFEMRISTNHKLDVRVYKGPNSADGAAEGKRKAESLKDECDDMCQPEQQR